MSCALGKKRCRQLAEEKRIPVVAVMVETHEKWKVLTEFEKNKTWIEFEYNPKTEGLAFKRKWTDEKSRGEEIPF
jgi:hypothetical protein